MNIVHLHLLLNHVPVIGIVFVIWLLSFALVRGSGELTRASFGFLALLGVISLVVYLTGEPAEESIERLPGYSGTLTEKHEEAALAATILVGAVGSLALAALVVFRRKLLPRWTAASALVVSLIAAAMMAYTANLGGQIRHTEIRGGSAAVNADARPAGESGEHGER